MSRSRRASRNATIVDHDHDVLEESIERLAQCREQLKSLGVSTFAGRPCRITATVCGRAPAPARVRLVHATRPRAVRGGAETGTSFVMFLTRLTRLPARRSPRSSAAAASASIASTARCAGRSTTAGTTLSFVASKPPPLEQVSSRSFRNSSIVVRQPAIAWRQRRRRSSRAPRSIKRDRAPAGRSLRVHENLQDALRRPPQARTDRASRWVSRPPRTTRRSCRACRRATRRPTSSPPSRAAACEGGASASTPIGR